MSVSWSETAKHALRPTLYKTFYRSKESFECPICKYQGPFKDRVIRKNPRLVRKHAKCVGCGAFERQRMLSLVIDDALANWAKSPKRLLHIAPERCLAPQLTKYFETYHTSDLFESDVDFNEDIQKMSFDTGSYDCVIISRVLTIPPDLESSVREARRILREGGMAIIAETYTLEKTNEYGEMKNGRSRVLGVDVLDLYGKHFSRVERITADRYPSTFQLRNVMMLNGKIDDNYPAEVRVPGVGFNDLVAVCHV